LRTQNAWSNDFLLQLPAPFDVEAISAAYPTTYEESMNTVLAQEAIRYNALLEVIDSSLRATLKALKGLVVMNPDLEKVVNSLYDNQVRAHGWMCLAELADVAGCRGLVDGCNDGPCGIMKTIKFSVNHWQEAPICNVQITDSQHRCIQFTLHDYACCVVACCGGARCRSRGQRAPTPR
jgi:hypothetical protein